MYKSNILAEVSHFRKVGEFSVKVPWPFWNRSMYVSVAAMPVENENAIIITMKTLKSEKWLKDFEIKKDTEKSTECFMNFCSIYIETISENVQKLRLICNVDPDFTYVPARLLNQGIKVIALVFLK